MALFDSIARLVLRADTSNYNSGLKNARTNTKNLESDVGRLTNTGAAATSMLKTMGVALGTTLVAAAGASLKAFADFDLQMKKVGAISGATAEEFDKLRAKARELGGQTIFTAREAGSAFESLARMGVSVADQLDMTTDVLALAEGQMIGLGESAEILNTTLMLFNKTSSESSRVADVLTTAANNSANTVQTLYNALRIAGKLSSEMGVSFTQTVAVMERFAEGGIRGERAGVALRNILVNLTSQSPKVKRVLDELGVSVFDQEGKMRDLFTILNEVRNGYSQLNDQQKANAAIILAGRREQASFNVLMGEGKKTLEEYKEQLEKSNGATKDQIDRLGGMSKAWKIFTSGISEAGLTFSETFEKPVVAGLENITGLIGAMTETWKSVFGTKNQKTSLFGDLASMFRDASVGRVTAEAETPFYNVPLANDFYNIPVSRPSVQQTAGPRIRSLNIGGTPISAGGNIFNGEPLTAKGLKAAMDRVAMATEELVEIEKKKKTF